jgi:PhnB protein
MQVQSYLFFYGRCEEALAFYRDKLGAEVLFMLRNKEAPGADAAPGEHGDQIMHTSFRVGDAVLMASDGHPGQQPESHTGFSLSLSLDDPAEAKARFDALAEGGQVRLEWQPTFFANGFGMLTDKFGIPWMIMAAKPMTEGTAA